MRHKLYDSYPCSRYNTQTKRLNESMLYAIFSADILFCIAST